MIRRYWFYTHDYTYYPGDEYLMLLDKYGNVVRQYNYGPGEDAYDVIAVGDVNGDGYDEIVIGDTTQRIILLNYRFEKLGEIWGYDMPILNDIDGDGKMEILARGYNDNSVAILSWDGYTFNTLWVHEIGQSSVLIPSDLDIMMV